MSARERELRRRLAQAVRRERERRGWTQEHLAERADLHSRHVQKLEYASVNVSMKTLARLCDALGVDVRRLFPAVKTTGTRKG